MTSQAGPESHEDNVHEIAAQQRHEDGLQKLRTRLFFPVDQIGEQLARLQTGGGVHTADRSGTVYCTAVLEVFCQHVLEKAVEAASDDTFWTKRHKEDCIIPRYVQLAVRKDAEVLAMLKGGKGGSSILSVMNRFLDSSTAKVLSELELLDHITEEMVNGELSLDSNADEGTLKQIHDKTVGDCESFVLACRNKDRPTTSLTISPTDLFTDDSQGESGKMTRLPTLTSSWSSAKYIRCIACPLLRFTSCRR